MYFAEIVGIILRNKMYIFLVIGTNCKPFSRPILSPAIGESFDQVIIKCIFQSIFNPLSIFSDSKSWSPCFT